MPNYISAAHQIPLAPAAGFLAAVPGEVEANQTDPRAHRGRPYPGGGTWERHVWARGQPLPLAAKAALRCLLDHDFGGGPVFPSIATIAEETGLSRTGAKDALRWLRINGWIEAQERRREDGGRSSNVYVVLDPPGREPTPPRSGADPEETRESEQTAGAARPESLLPKSQEEIALEAKAGPDLCDHGDRCMRDVFTEVGNNCLRCGRHKP